MPVRRRVHAEVGLGSTCLHPCIPVSQGAVAKTHSPWWVKGGTGVKGAPLRISTIFPPPRSLPDRQGYARVAAGSLWEVCFGDKWVGARHVALLHSLLVFPPSLSLCASRRGEMGCSSHASWSQGGSLDLAPVGAKRPPIPLQHTGIVNVR